MNKPAMFYRFFFRAIVFPAFGVVLIVGIWTVWRDELNALLEADGNHQIRYALTGLGTAGLISYLLLYGKPWAKGPVLSTLSFLVSWLFLEGVCGLVLIGRENTQFSFFDRRMTNNAPDPGQHTNFGLIRYDQLGISRPAPGPYETRYSTSDHPITITYHIDSLSRRVTPFDRRQANGKYALFLGCSFTYGESVADTSTMPYYFGKETGYRPYNYGVSGHSPAHMLALLQTVNIRNEVAEKNGIAFYTFIEDHLARVNPSTKWAYNSGGYLPYVNPANVVVEGSYAQKHPLRLKLIQWMYKSNIIKLFKINFPRRYTTEQYQRFVNIVKKSEALYRQQFGNDNFYVVIFPSYLLDPELRHLFEQAQLKMFDYSKLLSWTTAPDRMHPDGAAYRRVAQQLAQDVCKKAGQEMPSRLIVAYSKRTEPPQQRKLLRAK